jgi:hypothetical protein
MNFKARISKALPLQIAGAPAPLGQPLFERIVVGSASPALSVYQVAPWMESVVADRLLNRMRKGPQ